MIICRFALHYVSPTLLQRLTICHDVYERSILPDPALSPETLLKQLEFLPDDVIQMSYPSLNERMENNWFCEWLVPGDTNHEMAIREVLHNWKQNKGILSDTLKIISSVLALTVSGCKGSSFLLQFLLHTSLQNTNTILKWICENEAITVTSLKWFCEWQRVCSCIWSKHTLNVTEKEIATWCDDHMEECSLVYKRLCIYEDLASEEPFSIPSCFRDSSYDYQIITHHLTCRYTKQNQLAIDLLQFYPIAIRYSLYETRLRVVLMRTNDVGYQC